MYGMLNFTGLKARIVVSEEPGVEATLVLRNADGYTAGTFVLTLQEIDALALDCQAAQQDILERRDGR
jgi:hypothetical protein